MDNKKENLGRKFIVQVKSLKEQNLPPQWLFDNARGVMASHLAVKIKPKNRFLKMVTSKTWKSHLPVYLVINFGYLFVYTKKERGFVVNLRAGKVNKFENIKKEKSFHDQIVIRFKHAKLKLDFEDSEAYEQWVHLLKAIVNPEIDGEWLKNDGYASTAKERVVAERVDPPVGQKKDSDWVEVRRYPANTKDLNKTVFEETILQDVDDEASTFSPGRSSTRRDEYEFDLEDDDMDAGSEVFEEEESDFSLDRTDGNEEELSAAATRRSPSRAPSLRYQAPVESFDESNLLPNEYILSHASSLRSAVADSRVHHAFRSPSPARTPSTARSISRTPSTRRSPSRAPSLRSEARVPASPFSVPNESFSESNEDRGVLYAHASRSPARTPSRAPTPAISRTPSRAPTPRRAAAASPSDVSESFASRGTDPSYVPSEIDSQATATSSLRSLQARPSLHAPQALRRSERPSKKPQRYGYDDGKK